MTMSTNVHQVEAITIREVSWGGTRWTYTIVAQRTGGDHFDLTLFSDKRIAVEKLPGSIED